MRRSKRPCWRRLTTFDLRDVSFDKWNSSQLVAELEDLGIEMVDMRQGFASMTTPTKELLRLVVDEKLRHGGDPLLRWCASNVAAAVDPAGNVKLDKARSAHRIDPLVALVMAADGWVRNGADVERVSVYESRYGTGAAA